MPGEALKQLHQKEAQAHTFASVMQGRWDPRASF